jgi:hypothetical protein
MTNIPVIGSHPAWRPAYRCRPESHATWHENVS